MAIRRAQSSAASRIAHYLEDFGLIDRTGVTPCGDAIAAAFSAALADGLPVDLGAGTLNAAGVITNQAWVIQMPVNPGRMVKIRGAGRLATTVKLGSTATCFAGAQPSIVGTFGWLELEDFTVDAAACATGFHGVVFSLNGTTFNAQRVRISRVDSINCGNLQTGGGLRNVDITVNHTAVNSATEYTILDVVVENCHFGRSGGGGNTGILLEGFINTTKTPASFAANPIIANVFIDDFTFRGVRWDSGATPNGATSGFASAGIQVGQDGYIGTGLIDNCHVFNSGDVGFEIGSALNMTVRDSTATDCNNEGFFHQRLGNSAPWAALGRGGYRAGTLRWVGCTAYKTAPALVNMYGFNVNDLFGTEVGEVVIDACKVVISAPTLGAGGNMAAQAVFIGGHPQHVAIRDLEIIARGWTHNPTANGQACQWTVVRLALAGGRSKVDIDGLKISVQGTLDAATFTTPTWTIRGLDIDTATDAAVTVENYTPSFTFTRPNGGSAVVQDGNLFTGTNITEAWSAFSTLADYSVDLGQSSDLAINTVAATLTSVANHAVEKALVWLHSSSANYYNGTIGKIADGALTIPFTPGPTLAAYKVGVKLKEQDANNFIEAWVDGTNGQLHLDKVVGGVRSQLAAPVALVTALASGTQMWLRGQIIANAVTASVYLTNPGSSLTATTNTALSATLTGADAAQFGDRILGSIGWSWVPADPAATLGKIVHNRIHVLRANFDRWSPHEHVGSTQTNALNISSGAPVWRAPTGSWVRLRGCDWAGLAPAFVVGTDAEVKFPFVSGTTNGGVGRYVYQQATGRASGPASSTVTVPATTVAYVNDQGADEDLYTYGGTLTTPFVEISRDGGATWGQILNAVGPVSARLAPGDQARWTYTAVPTVRRMVAR